MNDQSTTDATRDRIVEAARELFFENGYTATGIAAILKRANARSGSLYHFFPTKEDLLIAVLDKYQRMLESHVIGPAFERTSDPIERVFAVLDGYRRMLEATEFRLGCPIGNLALEVTNALPNARQLVVANFAGWLSAIEQCIQEAAGRLPQDAVPSELAAHVLATMEGAVMLARTYHSFDAFDSAVHSLREYFERLLADGREWNAHIPRD